MAVTAAQIASLLVQAGLLLMGGVLGLLVRAASAKLGDLAEAVDELRREVADQGRALAGGDQRFTDIERRIGDLERKQEVLFKDGCARAVVCTGREK